MKTAHSLKGIMIASLIMATSNVMAVTVDGSLTTGNAAITTGSQGSFDINVTKEDAVQISNLNSITITQGGTATADLTGSDSVCYYATTNNYKIAMDSTNPTAFTVKDAGTNTMIYKLDWAETTGTDSESWGTAAGGNLGDAAFTGNLSSDNKTSANCGGGTNATITVTVPATSFNSAPTGIYTDTVNITIVGI